MSADDESTAREFREAVNMTAEKLEAWLGTDESQGVGQKKDGDDESVGHQYGRKIVGVLRMKPADYTADDLADMRKVVGYVRRHLAQRPGGDVTATRWRYSLMNWGHDPLEVDGG